MIIREFIKKVRETIDKENEVFWKKHNESICILRVEEIMEEVYKESVK